MKRGTYQTFKRTGILFFIVTLLFSMIGPMGGTVSAEDGLKFTDVKSTHWALKYIAQMEARGIVKGNNGLFRPEDSVTQVEAVIMAVRALGLEERAGELASRDISFDVPDWANGYVAVALEEGLLKQSDDFAAETKAIRAWVAQLMVRMIDKEQEAVSQQYAKTDFTDDLLISADYRGYVNAAVKYELVKGYNNGSFQPNKNVTRSEMVTLLTRSERYLEVEAANVDRGVLTKAGSSLITIELDNGSKKTFIVNNDTLIFNEAEKIERDQLQLNQRLMVVSDKGSAQYIEVIAAEDIVEGEEGTSDSAIEGTVESIYEQTGILVVKNKEDQTLETFQLSQFVEYRNASGNSLSGLGAIAVGDEVKVEKDEEGNVIRVTLQGETDNGENEGVVIALNPSTKLITIKTDAGSLKSYYYSDQVEVEYGQRRLPDLSDISEGDRVALEFTSSIVTRITLLKTNESLIDEGIVKGITPDTGYLVLETDGEPKAYQVAAHAEIVISGLDIAELSDVQVNDQVEVEVEDGVVQRLTVLNREVQTELSATVLSVDETNRLLTYQLEDGSIEVKKVSTFVELDIDGISAPTLADVSINSRVIMEMDRNQIIMIRTNYEVIGEVTRISETSRLIQLNVSGERLNYQMDPAVQVNIREMTGEDLSDIVMGDTVRLRLQNEIVTDIDVEKTFQLRVEDVNERRERLETVDEDDDKRNLYIRGDVELVVPGVTSPKLEDVKEGDVVHATYLGNSLVKVEVRPTYIGEVRSINLVSGDITVNTYDQGLVMIQTKNQVDLQIENQQYDHLRYLAVGDRVVVSDLLQNQKSIKVMEKVTGKYMTVSSDMDKIFVLIGGSYNSYWMADPVYLHFDGDVLSFRSLPQEVDLNLYMMDDRVYEVEVVGSIGQ